MTEPEARPPTPESTAVGPTPAQLAHNAEHKRRARARLNWVKRGFGLLFLVFALGTLVWAFMPKPVSIEPGVVVRGPLQVTIDEDGKARVKDRYVVSSPLLANLARIELSAGASVEPGTVLARLLPLAPPLLDVRSRAGAQERVAATSAAERQTHATVERVRSSLEFAVRETQRLRALHGQGAAAQQALDQAELAERSLREDLRSAEFGAKVADHELLLAQTALGLSDHAGKPNSEVMEVRAPIGGRVLRVLQQSEGVVQPGTPLLELGDPAALELVVDVLTSDAVQVKPGTRALIERWGGDDTLQAHVRLVEPSAFTRLSALGVEEQRVNVVLDLDSPRAQWTALGDGYRIEARLVVWSAASVVNVPASAVFRHGDGFALYRVVAGRARLTPVQPGHRNTESLELLSGAAPGTAVILHPSEHIVDGARVSEQR